MPARFDLITVDAVEPRATAAPIIEGTDFVVELDEDDGRWLVLASPTLPQRFGLQRSDAREVSARPGSLEDVFDGCITIPVADPSVTSQFFSSALELSVSGQHLEVDGRAVMRIVEGSAVPSNVHLDFICEVDEFGDEVDRLLSLGATRIGPHRSAYWGESQIFMGAGGGLFCLNAYPD